MPHPISDITAEGCYMTTTDRWHLGTLLTITLQRLDSQSALECPAHIVVLGKVMRQDETGAFLSFLPVMGYRRSAAVRPASKKEIVHFLRVCGAVT